jgi:hypothetical protein
MEIVIACAGALGFTSCACAPNEDKNTTANNSNKNHRRAETTGFSLDIERLGKTTDLKKYVCCVSFKIFPISNYQNPDRLNNEKLQSKLSVDIQQAQ